MEYTFHNLFLQEKFISYIVKQCVACMFEWTLNIVIVQYSSEENQPFSQILLRGCVSFLSHAITLKIWLLMSNCIDPRFTAIHSARNIQQ
uniref:Uncharacterized protein n=1 Tax=Octopus bimaculoides TaxID=37653 RepID=A0A0L8HCM1_OCTBM